jgi:hypothetical protein
MSQEKKLLTDVYQFVLFPDRIERYYMGDGEPEMIEEIRDVDGLLQGYDADREDKEEFFSSDTLSEALGDAVSRLVMVQQSSGMSMRIFAEDIKNLLMKLDGGPTEINLEDFFE